MFALIGKIFADPIVGAVVDIFKKYQDRKMTEAELQAEVEKVVLEVIETTVKTQGDVIMEENRSEDWLTRNWRPIVAMTAFFSYWYVIVLYPHIYAWGWLSEVGFGEKGLENLFYLTIVCVGGYVGGRTIEKVVNKAFMR